MNILIFYATLEGQTAKIAARITDILQSKGHAVTNQPIQHLPTNLNFEDYDAAILGGSIHMGKYPKELTKFIRQHTDWLSNIPSALFTVCMAIHSQQVKSREEAVAFGENLTKETEWHPSLMTTFAGAVKYTQYNFITRFIMKQISRKEGGSTDTTHDHEYTDWKAVEHFANQFCEKLDELQQA
jgi:menaquinone-dependent protoporphyrinogen oxidase